MFYLACVALRSPRDYVGPPFVRSFALSPLDGASVREAHCELEQASTAVREAHCEQASTAVRRTEAPCAQASTAVRFSVRSALRAGYCSAFSDIWKFEVEIFFRDQQRIVYEIRLIAIREVSPPFGEEHRGLEQDISFPGNKHLLILRKCYAVKINASSL